MIISFICHSALALIPPLNGDEATFWEWSRHLALGYYAHPPMTAWLVALFSNVFGVFKYSVRLPAILLHLGTCVFVYFLAIDVLKEKKQALLSAILFSVLPVSIVLGTAITTDAALVFCFTVAVYFVKKAIVDDIKFHWYSTAIACGGMLLTKFMAVLFFPGLLLFMLVNKKYRKVYFSKEPYLAALISLIIVSPFLYWNMNNYWLTFQFNLFMRHRDEGFEIMKVLKYIGGQMVATSPVMFIMLIIVLAYFLVHLSRHRLSDAEKDNTNDSLLLISYIITFPLVYFLGTSFGVEVAPHWAAVVYPSGSVLLVAWVYFRRNKRLIPPSFRSTIYWFSVGLSPVIFIPLIAVAIYPKLLPDHMIYTPTVHADAPVISHYFGWKEAGIHIDKIKKEWENRPEGLFFTSKDYSLASMLAFYTPSHPNYYLMNVSKDVTHGKSYLLWEKGKKKLGANTIYVSDVSDSYKTRIPGFFREVKHLDPLIIRDADNRILRIFYITIGIQYLGGEPDNLSLW